ncbi:MAG: 3'-5' exonuclease, partial [Candidatus Zixiibacteriota bacterium]
FDEDDAQALIKNCLDELNISRNQFPPASMRRKISAAKNKMIDSETFAKKASGYFESRTAQVYTLYEERLKQCGAFDFDDLIYRTVQLLTGRENIRNNYRQRFKYILVDEYQDTNHSQYQLLRLLIGEHNNICVVGDEDQSIYGWRGADISNILNFEKDFPGAKVIKMEQNYRSTEIILQAASTVIANNVSRKGKTLWTEVKSGDPLRMFLSDSAADEATIVVSDIEENLARCPLSEAVILYRTNAQSRPFEEALRRKNIPYQIIGGISFYQRKEIKDLMAYLKLIANTGDDISFQRIVNYPRRGIGNTSIEKLAQFARTAGKSMYETSRMADQCAELGSRPQKILGQFVELIEKYRNLKDSLDIGELTQQLVDDLRLLEQLISEDPLVGQGRVENVEEFISGANEFTNNYPEPNLDNFLAEITLYTDLDEYKEIDEKLTLMTLHTAKGLEFDSVYLVGLEEGLFPLARAIENPMELEEERRLFYVGATRARKYLQLAMATVRNRFGEMESIPSRFIKELPPALVEVTDRRSHHRREYESLRSVGSMMRREKTEDVGVHYEYEPEEAMREGRIVQHKTFGRGKVVRVEGSGEAMRLEIYFTGVGLKKIMAKYAQLKIVG